MGTVSFPGVKCGQGVLLTTHPLLVPWSWKSRTIPLPTLWATPGLYRDHFTFLLTGWSGDRFPVGTRFSTPGQTGPGAHPASYTMGIGSLPGVKRPGSGFDHQPLSSAKVEGRVELYICSLSGRSLSVLGWPSVYFCFLLYIFCFTHFKMFK